MKQFKMLLFSSMVIFFTACGGGSSDSISDDGISTVDNSVLADGSTNLGYYGENVMFGNHTVARKWTVTSPSAPNEPIDFIFSTGSTGVLADGIEIFALDFGVSLDGRTTRITVDGGYTELNLYKIITNNCYAGSLKHLNTGENVDVTICAESVTGINTPPVADAGVDLSVQVNQTITITGSGTDSDGIVISYEWRKGPTLLASTKSFEYAPTTVGIDTLTLTVTDDAGATASDSMDVIVTEIPDTTPPVITVLGDNPATVIQGDTYTDAGATAIDDRDGPITVTTTGNVDTSTAGPYTLTYTATDSAGNKATATRTVNVLLQELIDSITYMYSEERLAYDLYMNIYQIQAVTQLYNIAINSEIIHIEEVNNLAIKYDLNITKYPDTDHPYSTDDLDRYGSGEYPIESIQDLYTSLYTKGIQSPIDALEVGCMVEVADIDDLDVYIALAEAEGATDIVTVFNFLRDGSYNHYWTFDDGLKNEGVLDGCCSLDPAFCHPEYPQK